MAVMSDRTVRHLLSYVLKHGDAENDVWKKQLLSAIMQDLQKELQYPVSLSLPYDHIEGLNKDHGQSNLLAAENSIAWCPTAESAKSALLSISADTSDDAMQIHLRTTNDTVQKKQSIYLLQSICARYKYNLQESKVIFFDSKSGNLDGIRESLNSLGPIVTTVRIDSGHPEIARLDLGTLGSPRKGGFHTPS